MKNNFLIFDDESTDHSFGTFPSQRTIDQLLQLGIILLDKPVGPTSHEVVAWVRKILGIKKAGHSGTLDPLVSGLLPIGLGTATKALSVLLLGPKEYFTVARLHSDIDDEKINFILKEFTGEIYQRPPQKSSVKRILRKRTIYELDLVERIGNLLLLRILCQAGTYIRKLVYDIGEVIGSGATMVELRRSKVSHLSENNDLVRLHGIVDAVYSLKEENDESKIRNIINPVESAVSFLKSVVIRDSAVDALCNGAQLAIPGILRISKDIQKQDIVAIYTLKGELVTIGEALLSSEEIMNLNHGIAFITKRVIMKPNTYPRLWKDNPDKLSHK
jgi:H/ACA ribonucleoprotein complex subunit 4